MKPYDLIITGAGPGGSAAAYYAARLGLRVLLLDQSEFPRDKTCGDGLTPRAVYELDAMGLRDRLEPGAHRIRRVQVVSPGGYSILADIPTSGKYPDHAWVIPRRTLDEAVRSRAVAAGAEFAAPVRVTGIEELEGGVRVRGRSKQGDVVFQGALALAATGANMPLLKRIGLLKETPGVILAVRGYFEVGRDFGEQLTFRFDGVPLPGYGWIFPVSATVVNIGLGFWPGGRRARGDSPAKALEAFLAGPGIRSTFETLRPLEPAKGFPLRTDFATARTHSRRVLLVGEAAGLVNPMTGEGIDYALESGRIAAEFLAGAGLGADLRLYDERLRASFQSIFTFSNRLRRVCNVRFCLDLLARTAESRPAMKGLLAGILLGTKAIPPRISPWKVMRVLTGR